MAQTKTPNRGPLWPIARVLLGRLARTTDRERQQLTNQQLAAQLHCSPRTVSYALEQLQMHELVAISRRSPHPHADTTGRSIHILPAARRLLTATKTTTAATDRSTR